MQEFWWKANDNKREINRKVNSVIKEKLHTQTMEYKIKLKLYIMNAIKEKNKQYIILYIEQIDVHLFSFSHVSVFCTNILGSHAVRCAECWLRKLKRTLMLYQAVIWNLAIAIWCKFYIVFSLNDLIWISMFFWWKSFISFGV